MFAITFGHFADHPEEVRFGVGLYMICYCYEEAEIQKVEFMERFPGTPVRIHPSDLLGNPASVWFQGVGNHLLDK